MMLNLLARLGFVVSRRASGLCASAETATLPPLPDRNPFRAKRRRRGQPRKPVLPGDSRPCRGATTEIAAAKRECEKLLTGVTLDYEALPPIKEGICGAPAPILRQVDRQRSEGGDRSAGDA